MCSAPARTTTGFFVFSRRCILFVLLGSFSFAWTNTGGGDHGGASWAPANGATIGGTHTNVNTFTVSGTVYVNSGAPLQVYARTINVAGTINGNYAGYAGGTGGGTGRWYSGGGSGGVEGGSSGSSDARSGGGGGGGGGYGGRGSPGGSSGGGSGGGSSGAIRGGTYTRTIEMGSGAGGGGGGGSTAYASGAGGGSYGGKGGDNGGCTNTGACRGGAGGGNGGRGGGAVLLNASTVTVSGTITLNGGGGAGGGCGSSATSYHEAGEGGGAGSGASGGGVLVMGNSISFTGTIRAIGGPGGGRTGQVCDSQHYHSAGNAGGQGGGGRVKLFAASALSATGSVDVSGYESGTYTSCLGVCVEANSSCGGGYMYDGACDTAAPTGSISINNGAEYSAASVTLSLSCVDSMSGCSKMSFSNDAVSFSSEEGYAASKPWTLASGDGPKAVYVLYKDTAGNWGGPFFDTITLDTTGPTGTVLINNGAPYTNSFSVMLSLSCSDSASGCSGMSFSNDGVSFSAEEAYSPSKAWVLPSGDGPKAVYAKFKDAVGNWGAHFSDDITLDTTPPQITSLSSAPDPFSPNGDGVKDSASIGFSASEGSSLTLIIHPSGLSSVVERVVVDKGIMSGPHSEVWGGTDSSSAIAPEGAYDYEVALTDYAGNRNYAVGSLRVDLSPPEFVQQGASTNLVELGDSIVFSATLLDNSGIDSVFVCGTSANCRDGGALCRMENTSQYRDKFSCTVTPSAIGTYSYYIFANDTQNLFSNASGSFRVRKTGLSAPQVSLLVVDLQSKARISVDYLENDTYQIENANCVLSGGAGGSFSGTTNPYHIEVYPPKPERIDFVATCSKSGYPSRSTSGFFTGRDLDVELSYEDVPLAANYTNYLYAIVSTVNDPSLIRETADVRTFSISGPESFSGNMTWNGSLGGWVAAFTPTKYGTYSTRVDFKKDGIDGFRVLSMHSDRSLNVNFDAAPSVSIDMGSSAVLKLYVTNKGPKGRLYNVSFLGALYPVAFDGMPLSGRRYSETVFVPADTTQEHILLIKGIEVSPFERSFLLRVANVEKPNIFEEREVRYKVVYSLAARKFAPDLDFAAIVLLALASVLFIPKRKSPVFP